MSSGNNNSYQQSTSAYNVPSSTQRPQSSASSLLLNSVNLAWSQPTGCIIVAPKPEPDLIPTAPQMSLLQDESSSVVGDDQSLAGRNKSDSPDSTASTVNTSEYGKISSVSLSDFERLSIADSTKTSTSNLDSISHQAVAGSNDSFSVLSSDSGSAISSPTIPQPENVSAQQQQPAFYKEVEYHWYFQKDPNQKDIWQPFSNYDSYNLEYGFRCGWLDSPIPTNGTRYDVLLRDRTRKPVYWQGPSQQVQRCSWFFKRDSDYRFVPYAEDIADILENTYR